MRTLFGLVALLVAFAGPRSAGAQGVFGLTPPRPGDLPVAPGKGITDKHAHSWPYYFSTSPRARNYFVNPYGSLSISRVTFLYVSPLSIAAPQPIVIMPPARQHREEDPQVERIPPPSRPRDEAPEVIEVMVPGAPASVFRPIRPADRARALVPAVANAPKPDQPAHRVEPAQPGAVPPQHEPHALPGPAAAPTEPKTANAQKIQFGKEALQARQYSRAERDFRRAAEAFPEDPLAYFLLAQAQFALGKYAEAVSAIHAGMRLQPDWPSAAFRPHDLYGPNPDDFTEELKRLATALAKGPDDPFLTFLYAHQLWFDNRKDEARLMFQRAKALAPDPSFSERFLQAKAGSPSPYPLPLTIIQPSCDAGEKVGRGGEGRVRGLDPCCC